MLSLPGALVSAAGEPVVVGVVISTSGPSAPLGVPEKNGFLLVERDVNAKGGINGRPLHFEIVDDEAKPDVAAQLAQQLIGKGAVAIICGTRTATSAAVTRVTTGANVVQIFLTPSTELWKTPKGVVKTLFQAAAAADDEARAYVGFAKDKLKVKTTAIIHDENQYGTVAAAATEEALKGTGITVVANESVSRRCHRLHAATPAREGRETRRDHAARCDQHAGAVGRCKRAHARPQDAGARLVRDPDAGVPAGRRSEPEDQLYGVSNLDFTHPNAVTKVAIKEYVEEYKAPLVGFAAFAEDAGNVLARALIKTKGKFDGSSVATALETMAPYPGTTGTFRYTATDHNGLSAKDVHMAVARKGVWFTID